MYLISIYKSFIAKLSFHRYHSEDLRNNRAINEMGLKYDIIKNRKTATNILFVLFYFKKSWLKNSEYHGHRWVVLCVKYEMERVKKLIDPGYNQCHIKTDIKYLYFKHRNFYFFETSRVDFYFFET